MSLLPFYQDETSLQVLQNVVESVNECATTDGRLHNTSIETQVVTENVVIDNLSTPSSDSGALAPDPMCPIFEVDHEAWENELSNSQRQSIFRTHNILIHNRPTRAYTVCTEDVKELLGNLYQPRTIHGMSTTV